MSDRPGKADGAVELSAPWTPLYKFGLPLGITAYFGYLFLWDSSFRFFSSDPFWFPALWFALMLGWVWWDAGRLKRIRLDGETLLISDYLREVSAPLSDVVDVKESYASRGPKKLTLVFEEDTGLGRRVTFIPSATGRAEVRQLMATLRGEEPPAEGVQPRLTLTTGTGTRVDDPDPQAIDQVLRELPGTYAVLTRGVDWYLQATGSPSQGFMLEARGGTEDTPYESVQKRLPLDAVVTAFRLYAEGEQSFADGIDWVPMAAADEERTFEQMAASGGGTAERRAAPEAELPQLSGVPPMPDIPNMSEPIHPTAGCLGVMTLSVLAALSMGIILMSLSS